MTKTISARLPNGQFVDETFNYETGTIPTAFVLSSTETVYNLAGQVKTTTDQYGHITETVYDVRGLQIETRMQGVDTSGTIVWLISRTFYDAAGQATASTEQYVEGTTAPIFGTISHYDKEGRVEQTDRVRGIVIDITGSGELKQAVLTNAGTIVASFSSTFDNSGKILTSTDEYNRVTRTTYNSKCQVTETRRQSYDETGTLVWLVSRTLYDNKGRAEYSTDQTVASGASLTSNPGPAFGTQTHYDSFGRVDQTTRRKNLVINVDFTDGSSSPGSTGTIEWTTSTVYAPDGRTSRTIAADGQTTSYVYDNLGRQTAVLGHPQSLADVGLTATDVGLAGLPGTITIQLRTETVFDPATGRVQIERRNVRHLTRDNAGAITVTIDSSAAQDTSYEYDEFGNVTKTTFDDGSFVSATYDQFQRKETETNQIGQTRTFEYAASGRLKAVVLPPVPDPLNGGALTTPRYDYAYDVQGRQTLLRDPLGRETRFTFNAQGQQLTRTLPLGFGVDGKLGTTDDPVVGWTPSSVPANMPFTERMTYDTRGRMTLAVSFQGVVTQYVYSATTGELTNERFFPNLTTYNNGTGTPSEVWSFTNDAFGRPVSVARHSVASGQTLITTMKYDSEGRLKSETSPQGGIGYDYDLLGRLAATKVFAKGANPTTATPQRITSYAYDPLGRLSTVTEDRDPASTLDPQLATSYGYDLVGNLHRTDLPNGVITTNTFDALNRLDVLTHYAPDSTPNDLTDNAKLADFDYDVRADGRRSHVTERFWKDGAVAAPLTNNIDWEYDNLGRLLREMFDSTDNALDYTDVYSLDLTGNRRTKTHDQSNDGSIDETTTGTFDANDRLLQESIDRLFATDSVIKYAYGSNNAATQQTSKTTHTGTVATNANRVSSLAFSYDLQGRLEIATNTTFQNGVANRIEKTTYDYNATGIRVSALTESDTNANGTYETRVLTEFLNDAHNHTGYSQVIRSSEYDANTGVLQKTIDYSFGQDEIAQTTTTYAAGNVSSSETLIFHHDGHGSVRVLTDLAAAIIQLYAYDAYGQLLAIWNATGQRVTGGNGQLADATLALTNLLYSGEQFDTRIGQQYLRARYYDASSGRFNRLDPFVGRRFDPQTFHKFLYTHADPITGVDPTGHDFSIGGMLGGIGIGNSLAGIKTGVDTAVLDSVWATVQGASEGRTAAEVYASFVVDQLQSFVIGLAIGKLLKILGGIWENGITFRPQRTRPPVAQAVAAVVEPIRTGDGLRRISQIRRETGALSNRLAGRNVAYAEIEIDGINVAEVRALSGQKWRTGFLPPPEHGIFDYDVVGGFYRRHDSEAIILDSIGQSLSPDSVGTIRLFSERPICTSCNSVIQQFQERFPGVRLVASGGVTPVGLP